MADSTDKAALVTTVAEEVADLLALLLKRTDDGQPDEDVSDEEQIEAITQFADAIGIFDGEDLREDWREILAAARRKLL
jgi:hypothetical protein